MSTPLQWVVEFFEDLAWKVKRRIAPKGDIEKAVVVRVTPDGKTEITTLEDELAKL